MGNPVFYYLYLNVVAFDFMKFDSFIYLVLVSLVFGNTNDENHMCCIRSFLFTIDYHCYHLFCARRVFNIKKVLISKLIVTWKKNKCVENV